MSQDGCELLHNENIIKRVSLNPQSYHPTERKHNLK